MCVYVSVCVYEYNVCMAKLFSLSFKIAQKKGSHAETSDKNRMNMSNSTAPVSCFCQLSTILFSVTVSFNFELVIFV